MFSQIVDSFCAFNENGFNHLIYSFTSNWWLIFLVVGAIASVVMGVKEQASTVVREEQQIL